jgi:hypothetical protein
MGALAPETEMNPPTPLAGSGVYLANKNREFGALTGVGLHHDALISVEKKKCTQWRLLMGFCSYFVFSDSNKAPNV